MTGQRLVFLDTETTSLGSLARPWEIALIVRDRADAPSEAVPAEMAVVTDTEYEYVFHVEYYPDTLPAGTTAEALEVGRWHDRGCPSRHGDWLATAYGPEVQTFRGAEWNTARTVHELLQGAILIGVGVHFDAAVLAAMFRRHGLAEEPWHYAIVDLKAATWGMVAVRTAVGVAEAAEVAVAGLPLRSEPLAVALGVEPATADERHTALGDARWARRWFDRLTTQSEVSR